MLMDSASEELGRVCQGWLLPQCQRLLLDSNGLGRLEFIGDYFTYIVPCEAGVSWGCHLEHLHMSFTCTLGF